MKKSAFHIVLEGPDASGKKTQSTLLVEKIIQEGHRAERVSFPVYTSPYGKLITQYLEGNSPSQDPAYASMLYASDRALAAPKITQLLEDNTWVVCDRYVQSNLAHQVANLPEKYTTTADTFAAWIENTEYTILGIPHADVTIVLNVPYELCLQKAVERKVAEGRPDRVDILEDSTNHIRKAWELYQNMAAQNGWPVVDCAPNGVLLPREVISAQIWQIVQKATN